MDRYYAIWAQRNGSYDRMLGFGRLWMDGWMDGLILRDVGATAAIRWLREVVAASVARLSGAWFVCVCVGGSWGEMSLLCVSVAESAMVGKVVA